MSTVLEAPPSPSRQGLRFWGLLAVISATAIFFLYRREILFYDCIYYLRTVANPAWHHFSLTPYDRWTHINFLWALVKALGGASAAALIWIQFVYFGLMTANVLVWWKVFERFFSAREVKSWGLLLLATCPLAIYNAYQILPEHWSFLFTGLALWIYFAALERRLFWAYPVSGLLFYLGFLSRSDSLLLPLAIVAGSLISRYRPLREQFAAIAATLLVFAPILAWHLKQIGFGNVAPMGRAMWEYKMPSWSNNFLGSLREFGRGAGLFFPFAVLSILNLRKDTGVRVLAWAGVIVYAFFLVWIASGHFAYGRHTMQGAILLAGLGAPGFVEALRIHERAGGRSAGLVGLYAGLAVYFILITSGRFGISLSLVVLGSFVSWMSFQIAVKRKWPPLLIAAAGLALGVVSAFYLQSRWHKVNAGMRDFLPLAFASFVFLGWALQSAWINWEKAFSAMPQFMSSRAKREIPLGLKRTGFLRASPVEMTAGEWKQRMTILFFTGCLLFHIGLANTALGGVYMDQARKIYEKARSEGMPLLVADDPTFYFYRFYYAGPESERIALCFSGGDAEHEDYYLTELEKQLGSGYASSLEDMKSLGSRDFIFVGDKNLTWLGRKSGVVFEPAPGYGSYKGQPIMKVRINA